MLAPTAITTGAIVTDSDFSLGSGWGDYDNDGDLDIYSDGPTGTRALYRNDTANGDH